MRDLDFLESPFSFKCFQQAPYIRSWIFHLRRFHLDIIKPDHGMNFDFPDFCLLANHLSVDLTLGRNIDHTIPKDLSSTPQPPSGFQSCSFANEFFFRRIKWGTVRGCGHETMFRKFTGGMDDLAACADPSAAAYRIQVHPKRTGCLKNRGSVRETPALP